MTLCIPWQRVRTGVLLGAIGVLVAFASMPCRADGYSEDAIKAAFLWRFSRFVDWPPGPADDSLFTIAVLGAEGVAGELQRLLPVARRPTQVRKIKRVAEIGDAQMLYVGPGHVSDLRAAVAAITTRPVLLVADDEHGLDAGATVNFLLIDQRVRFEVSVLAAERARLKLSAELISVATRVQGGRWHSEVLCSRGPGTRRDALSCGAPAARTTGADTTRFARSSPSPLTRARAAEDGFDRGRGGEAP